MLLIYSGSPRWHKNDNEFSLFHFLGILTCKEMSSIRHMVYISTDNFQNLAGRGVCTLDFSTVDFMIWWTSNIPSPLNDR
jgi:hypothetical protein